MSPRPIFSFASLVLIAGAIVLIFFVLLAGAINGNPVNQVYFLQADTSAIPGAPALSQWTLWNVCGSNNGLDTDCGVAPAFPFDPQNNFNGQTQRVPESFIGTNKYYYETRFMFAFVLIAVFFAVSALFLGLFALCSRIGSYLSSIMCFIALFFQTIVAALMTATYVEGRNNFNANNQAATLGRMAFGFVWGAMACLLLATGFFYMGGSTSRNSSVSRKRSTRSRGSFIDNDASSFRRA